MLNTQTINALRGACDEFNVPVPAVVLEADALNDAAVNLLNSIRTETAPDLSGLTVKNLKATHEQIVAQGSHDAREQAAAVIVQQAASRLTDAWHQSTTALMAAFREPFDRAAEIFTTNLRVLGGNVDAVRAIDDSQHGEYRALMSAAADLATLGRLRDGLASAHLADVGNPKIERLGRVLTLPDLDVATRKIPAKVEGLGRFEPKWWAALAGIDGVVIKWHTPAEQQTHQQLARVNADHHAYSATVAPGGRR
ncbi:hypothetical protein [Cellulomonas sp. P24]|uniref:hypothetical protein n=1 Tax=Cellulomonas sp. P24 TaxID=2885206 RepID=UPI00216B5925|nr:hypothetical protein [Cellulomonas sp. P24]MCR6491712.1 hypothetical protein [Cellulomonas sp. P24]